MNKYCDYDQQQVPQNYICSKCQRTNCKLWRPYNSFHVELLCAECAGKDQHKDVSQINSKGMIFVEFSEGLNRLTDQIGWYVPAIPDEDLKDAYWGYTSVPQTGICWWKKLPSK